MKLSELTTGEKGFIVKVMGRGAFRKRIIEMGFVKGKQVEVLLNAPLKDPIKYRVMGYEVSLRRCEAALVEVVGERELSEHTEENATKAPLTSYEDVLREIAISKGKTIDVALVGNPNAGKTSLFNQACGTHEHVGNYGGVTVDAKRGKFKYKGYTFNIVDLPGTYSLSAYSPEELYVRKHITEKMPDVIINVVAASNLERNLLLTTQLIDMDMRMVVALNMYDELEERGSVLNHRKLATLLGVPMVPTVSKRSKGIDSLFDEVIAVYEDCSPVTRHIHISYGEELEKAIAKLNQRLMGCEAFGKKIAKRAIAIKLLEGDREVESMLDCLPEKQQLLALRDELVKQVEGILQEDCETAITDARYGFIAGALRETYTEKSKEDDRFDNTKLIDSIVTNKVLGFPIFLFFMWLMFETTFKLGAYPQQWIEAGVAALGSWIKATMSEGALNDLLADGIVGGVGSVVVFLPNILILYFFISLMEDTGYMARAAFIMDKLMHRMGLHGKSFIPLVMGFGCNVPAIMATRMIESRNNRMITMLVLPFISCSARLPVYVLLVSAFFSAYASWVMLGIYIFGILLAILMARLFKKFVFKKEDLPFVMEFPPYRTPTLRSIVIHMWEKGKQYLKKMGQIILIASVAVWFLSYYPRNTSYSRDYEGQMAMLEAKPTDSATTQQIVELKRLQTIENQQNSYIGHIGRFIEPAIRPLGFDWKIGVSLFTGLAAKELVVSTVGVLYAGNGEEDTASLSQRLAQDRGLDGKPSFTPLIALSLMLFILIYFPCIAVIAAIKNESGSWRWALFTVLYTTGLAWIASFILYQAGSLLGF